MARDDVIRLTLARKIDAACDRFEAAWKSGKKPRLEDFLGEAKGQERTELLRALLRVELELLGRDGTMPDASVYRDRFPSDGTVLSAVFQEAARRTMDAQAGDTSVASHAASTQDVVCEAVPRTMGRFEILQVLGQGGFGKVYRARDPQLDREVAIKVPLESALTSADDIERFLREARAAATLHHPNICPVYEVGQEGERYFIVMGLVKGKSLAAILKERSEPLPVRQTALLVRKLAQALAVAHAQNIVHRDLKPANLMIDRDRKEVVITDFGLARRRKAGAAVQTKEGVIMGSPAYMSPEQARGDVRAVGPAADVYSLGVILYEMISGRLPFSGTVTEVLGKVLHVEPDPPSKHRAGVDPALEKVCLKAMAKDPAERYPSMTELANALTPFLRESAAATMQVAETAAKTGTQQSLPTPPKAPRAKTPRRRPLWPWLAAGAGAAAIMLLGIMFFARTPTATVLIQIDVNLDDPALTFVLDDKEVPADKLRGPVELRVGKHELVVRRGAEEIRRFHFDVAGGAEPAIVLKEERPRPPVVDGGKDGPKKPAKILPARLPAGMPPGAPVEAVWKPLFAGKDLARWDGEPGVWRLDKDVLIGARPTTMRHATFLVSKHKVRDFELRFQAKLKDGKGGSGVLFRGEALGDHFTRGPLCKIGDGWGGWGHVVTEKSGKPDIPIPPEKQAAVEKKLKRGDFNDYLIQVAGKHVKVQVNGVTVVDAEWDALPEEGVLAFQVHEKGTEEVQFRNVEIKEGGPDVVAKAPEGGGTTLFGKDLGDWEGLDEHWKLTPAGDLVGSTPKGLKVNTHLCSKKKFRDFELSFRVKVSKGGNSGVQIRSEVENRTTFQCKGPQCDIGQEHWGSLYGERSGGMMKAAPAALVLKTVKEGDWNDYFIRCVGKRVTTKVNGETMVDEDFPTMVGEGIIAWQLHAGPPMEVTFSDIRIKEVKALEGEWISLFNGKDLSGWKMHPDAKGKGEWQVEKGILFCSGPGFNHLFSERGDYQDLAVRVEARINSTGNSGLVLRMPFEQRIGGGYEAQIDAGSPTWKTGTLFIRDGKPTIEIKDPLVAPDTWFTMEQSVVGNRVVIKINDKLVVDHVDAEKTWGFGHIALQQRTGKTKAEFRKIEAKLLKGTDLAKKPPDVGKKPPDVVKGPADWFPPLGPPKMMPSGLSEPEEEMLRLINEFRAKNGRGPRKINMTMCKVARAHSENMAKQDKLDHVLDGKGPTVRAHEAGLKGGFGENCAGGGRDSIASFFQLWTDSKHHRANLLSDRAEMGVGFAISSGGHVHWYTAMFGDKQ